MISKPSKILSSASANYYALGAFNVFNLETVKAVVSAAEKMNSPVIIETSESEAAFAGIENIAALAESIAADIEIPVVLNFDHGKKIESIESAIRAGYGSVMIDASELSFEENISKTKEVVKMAHTSDVWVEAELGTIPTPGEDGKSAESYLTNVDEAKEFVKRTGIDALAVAVGNQHGFYKADPKINLQRLKELREAVTIPLVLHGGSGIPDEDIRKAIGLGIVKINVNTELRVAYVEQLRKSLMGGEIRKPHEVMGEVIEAVKKVVMNKIRLFSNFNINT